MCAPMALPVARWWPDKLMRDALALELHQEVKLTTGEKVKKLRLVARSLVDNAIDDDTTAARECFDRMDGKLTQSVDCSGYSVISAKSMGAPAQPAGRRPAPWWRRDGRCDWPQRL